ncbi:efflux transporter outer membrane subunit, partial [Rubrivivax gelatinosus]|uniref:efflux transporter outer membrane subunit n=1 Tax=Rubrivivax gelatinosus TaxID=28068 RepID=UPI0005C1B075
ERWWTGFGDTTLDGLVERALDGQPSLQVAAARLRQAEAAVGVASAGRLPQVQGTVDMTRQRFTENGPYPAPLAGSYQWNNAAQIGASWELDLFGRERNTIAAALGQSRAAEAELQAARVLLAANVVSAYVNLGRLVENREVARQSLAQREQILTLVRQRIAAGLDTTVELRQAEGLIAQSRVDLEALDESTSRARHALAELTGQGPNALEGLMPSLAPLHSTPLPAGLPADLLGRRPDLRAAELRLRKTLAQGDAVRASYYPTLSLTGSLGGSSSALGQVLANPVAALGSGLALPFLNWREMQLQGELQRANYESAAISFRQTLYAALAEVEDALSARQALARQGEWLEASLQAARRIEALYEARYRAGAATLRTWLDAQESRRSAEVALAENRFARLKNQVTLIKALGGAA